MSLLHISFNQDDTCIACGTESGYCVYNCDPLKKIFDRKLTPKTGIKIIELLFRCNIVALVGDGQDIRFTPNKVVLWNDNDLTVVGELSFRSDIKAVKLRRDRIVIVLLKNIYVYQLSNLSLLEHHETVENARGLCAVCPDSLNAVLACPGLQKGYVQVNLYDAQKSNLIDAHKSELGCLKLTSDGTKLATASEKGTVIRIFDSLTGLQLQELQRGHEYVTIYCISFHKNMKYLACSSDKGTIHVFRLNDNSLSKTDNVNKTTTLSFLQPWLPKCQWFEKQWSFCQFRIATKDAVVGFGDNNAIIVACKNGQVLKAMYDETKMECIEAYSENILTKE